MITDKQRQFDYEYEADYQTKSRYTTQQWVNILSSETFSEEDIEQLKQVYASYNHAANLLQLSFHTKRKEEEILASFNEIGEKLAQVNDFKAEVDFDGNEYWWYLFFWGKNLPEGILEFKMHPELTEAVGSLYPEMEQAYYAFMGDVERSLQTRYNQEDSVWIAAAVLLYEKYYRNPGISSDDILLMQYEVQTRAQKVYGQDVNANTITQICNADERGHRFNYLRDIYKYYRVSFPGEFEGDRERPDPENVDYQGYIYSLFGYVRIAEVEDFIEHEYAHVVDDSYVELNASNGFVRMAEFLSRQSGMPYTKGDTSDTAIDLVSAGEDVETTFHMIADSLIKEYPNFTFAKKASWLTEDNKSTGSFCDTLYIKSYSYTNAQIAIRTIVENDAADIEISLNLPKTDDEEAMLDIADKCNMLTLMTAAAFQVEECPVESFDLIESGVKIKASVRYPYNEFMTMTEENIIGLFGTSLQIFASYYTDICQNYYPDTRASAADALSKALGDKVIVRQAADVPNPTVIRKERTQSSVTAFVEKTLQEYGKEVPAISEAEEDESVVEEMTQEAPDKIEESSSGKSVSVTQASAAPGIVAKTPVTTPATSSVANLPQATAPVKHLDRQNQAFHLYPKNTLIQGPVKTGKFHEALITAVGIIEGKDSNMIHIEPFSNILESFKLYEEAGKILHISYPDIDGRGYEGWIEGRDGREGIFKRFANQCGEGRYVLLLEDVDLNWMHLFGETSVLLRENRREGASSETIITLKDSFTPFKMPSNLYIVATCDSVVSEDTILGAIHHDFFVRQIAPDPSILRGMRVEGISLERFMSTINLRLSYFLGANYQLGEGFFLETPDNDPFISLARVFREQIIPLLTMWLDNDHEKIRYVLGDNAKTRPDTIFFQETPFREGLFKGLLPDSFDTEMCIYQINEEAFFNPKSYIDVY